MEVKCPLCGHVQLEVHDPALAELHRELRALEAQAVIDGEDDQDDDQPRHEPGG